MKRIDSDPIVLQISNGFLTRVNMQTFKDQNK